jgi:hypothetical protein
MFAFNKHKQWSDENAACRKASRVAVGVGVSRQAKDVVRGVKLRG